MSLNHTLTNAERAQAAWGQDMPRWVQLLATAADSSSQRAVAERLGRSSGYVSRLINRSYTGSYPEAEGIVRAAYGDEDVVCPIWGPIPLASCRRNRRRKGPPHNRVEHSYLRHCPTCPNNTDGQETGA